MPSPSLGAAAAETVAFCHSRLVPSHGRARPCVAGDPSLSSTAALGTQHEWWRCFTARVIGLRRDIAVLCKNVMKTDIERLSPRDSALVAARIMRKAKVGFLPVCDETAKVLGTLSDRDLTIRLLADDLPSNTPVGALATPDALVCQPSDDIAEALRLMAMHRKPWILCVDSDRRLLGTISFYDLALLDQRSQSEQRQSGLTINVGATVVDANGETLGTVTRRSEGSFFTQTNGFSQEVRLVLDDDVAWSSRERVHLKKTTLPP